MKTSIALIIILPLVSFASAGRIIAWGSDPYGQVSNVPEGDDFIAIGAGAYYGIALRENGSIVCWGNDSTGVVSETPSGNDFIGIVKNGASLGANAYAIKSDGSLVVWGYSSYAPAGTGFTKVDCMNVYGVALKNDNSIVAWKEDGSLQDDAPTGNNFKDITADAYHALALRADGTIAAWGDNSSGQCNVPSGNDFIDIACAYGTTSYALKQDGTIDAWGWLGPSGRVNPPQDGDVVKIFSSYQFNGFGLRADGSIVGWGVDINGVLSDMPTGKGYIDIASGEYWAMALIPEPTSLLLLGLGCLLIRKR